MKQEFSEKEAADSMQAAASRLGVPLALVKRCKRQGSRAFRAGRVYLRELSEMIAAIDEPDSFPFNIPTSFQSKPETIEEFRDLLRTAIRCGWLATGEILQIILGRLIEARGPELVSKEFGKVAATIHNGFGAAVMLLEADPATDDFVKLSAAKLDRNAQSQRRIPTSSSHGKHVIAELTRRNRRP